MEPITAKYSAEPADSNKELDENYTINIMLDDNLPEVQCRFLLRLLQGNIRSVDDIRLQAEQLQIPYSGDHYCVCIITADASFPNAADSVLSVLQKKIYASMHKRNLSVVCSIDMQYCLTCVFYGRYHESFLQLKEALSQLIGEMRVKTGIDLYLGTGTVVSRLELLSESANAARLHVKRSISEKIAVDSKFSDNSYNGAYDIHQYLLQLFHNGDVDGIVDTVMRHVEAIRLSECDRQVLVERFAVLYLQNITNECVRMGITPERFESYVPAVVCLMQLDSAGSIDAILQLTKQILKYISVHRTKEGNRLLTMAKEYIKENISDDKLDLAKVGDHVGLSRVYFCKLFHQMEGISFSAYVKKVRIEKAKHLLLTTNMKVFEVGNAVGFSHAKYFGQVFKEAVGQTPLEFQKGINKEI